MSASRVGFVLLALLASAPCSAAPVPKAAAPKAPEPLPIEVVAKWEDAGFQVGWMDLDWPFFHTEKAGRPGEIPAFCRKGGNNLSFDGLPAPAQPFGLTFVASSVGDDELKELGRFKQLHALDLRAFSGESRDDGLGVAAIAAAVGLKRRARKEEITDDGLKHLAPLKQLRALSLSSMPITDDGLKHLVDLSELQRLGLFATKVSGLKALAKLPELRWLNVGRTPVGDDAMKVVSTLSQLCGLYLHDTKVTSAGLKHLVGLTELRHFAVEELNDEGLVALGNFTKLEELRHRGSGSFTDDGLKRLAGLTELRKLELHSRNITGSGLPHFAKYRNLEDLDLSYCRKLEDEQLRHLAHLKCLQRLSLWDVPLTDAGLKHLAGLTELKCLALDNTKVTGAGLKHLTDLTNLRILSLSGTRVTDDGLKHLAGMSKLEILNLDGTKITDAGLKDLSVLKSLLQLELDETEVTESAAAELQKALPKCGILVQLR